MDSISLFINVPKSKVFRNIKVLFSNWLLNSKIPQLETLKLFEVLVSICFYTHMETLPGTLHIVVGAASQ